ncbi:MAG: helix-turn-helix transcriptional regulator [Planctomycetes bacterium]|nr:helix-turn-helix transcriptional regulator [Planctomycetota bacterium]
MRQIEILFGQAVRRRRERLGISQKAFAQKAGIHRTYASSVELGKVTVSIRIACQLAQALGVPLSKIWNDVERLAAAAERDRAP